MAQTKVATFIYVKVSEEPISINKVEARYASYAGLGGVSTSRVFPIKDGAPKFLIERHEYTDALEATVIEAAMASQMRVYAGIRRHASK